MAFDGHPGNFVVRADGGAVLVDLEKCRYSYPGLDLAHATLYTSTTWDVATHAVLTHDQVAEAYRQWADAVGPELAQAAGARVFTSAFLGKGGSMEEGLLAARHDTVLYLDGDLAGLSDDLVELMTDPVLKGQAVQVFGAERFTS